MNMQFYLFYSYKHNRIIPMTIYVQLSCVAVLLIRFFSHVLAHSIHPNFNKPKHIDVVETDRNFNQNPIIIYPCRGLDTLQAARSVQCLDHNKLDSCRWGESRPHRDESSPETQRPVPLGQLGAAVEESLIKLLVALVHQRCSDPIEGTHGAGHGQSGYHGRAKGRSEVLALPSGRIGHKALGNVVDSHLGRIQDTCPHDVGANAPVESSHAVLGVKVTEGLSQGFGRSAVGLCHRLEDVEGVTDQRSGTPRDCTGCEFEVERGFFFGGIGLNLFNFYYPT